MAKGVAGNMVRTITCAGCGETVTGRMRPGQTYCSLGCYRSGPRPQRRTGQERSCEICGGEFYVAASRPAHQGRFCSTDCHDAHQGRNKTEHTCKICGSTFRWSPSRTASGSHRVTYCSLACRDADPERLAQLREMNTSLQLRRTTRIEAAGYALLDDLGIDHQRQVSFNGKFTPDALIPTAQLVVQFDGDYWHDRAGTSSEPRVLRRVALDRSQDAYARACGWEVVRLWGSDLLADPAACGDVVRRHLRPPL
jgi:very-short-patch-repair endonuclease